MRLIKNLISVFMISGVMLLFLTFTGCSPKWSETQKDSIFTVVNKGGQTLKYSAKSGIKLLTVDRFAFKDLNKNGKLDKYEDWRLSFDERAKDLASQMTVEQIAGLMLYSGHQAIPAGRGGFFRATYNGKPFEESGAKPYDLTDQQKKFLTEDNLRHVLITMVQSPEIAATWNNNVQALAEGTGLGIPANNSSDPRHGSNVSAEYNAGAGGKISMWPGSLGLAATFDPDIVKQFGDIASREYRALGIATALSPQIDLSTEPRWNRTSGTFGEDPKLATDMAQAYVDGFQTSGDSSEIKDGWGYNSVNAMVKHWPGGGPEEGGRDGHFGYGKYAVYPGNNLKDHLKPFIDGAFKLKGKTSMASAVMPYYTISFNQDTIYKENVGNSYSKYIITNLLREKYGYDGVVCTDWMVTADVPSVDVFAGKSWGMETKTVAERHYKVLMAGVDQFGGNNESGPVMEAYQMGVKEHGEKFMRDRFEQSAVRLLKNIFRTGLFENPYLDAEKSTAIVGNAEFMKAGYDTQLKSVVMLKNKANVLPIAKNKTVYVPKRTIPARTDWFGNTMPERVEDPVNLEIIKKYFNVTDDPAKADFAICFIQSPSSGVGYDKADLKKGGNGYIPISLQYGAYKADFARDPSIAGGDPKENFVNRSFKGKTVTASNISDLKMVINTRKVMGNKPVITVIDMDNPMVFSEFESTTDAILIGFGVQAQSLLDIMTGVSEPSGLLPLQMPANMKTVEEQKEDIPRDMECYTDSQGNTYDFGYGLNWKGLISDERTSKYKIPVAK